MIATADHRLLRCTVVLGAMCLPQFLLAQAGAAVSRDTTSRDSSRVRGAALAPVVVTSQRARSVPPPVATIVLDTAQLARMRAGTAYDVVRRVAGIEVHEQGQGPGFTSNVVIRGFNSDHSADALLVIDGVPINAPIHGHVEGFADWNLLLPAAVADMRLIAGTASPLHGDFALAGVMEVFTAADAAGTAASMQGSSFGDASAWLRTGRRAQRGGFMVAGEGQRQRGWQQNSAYGLGNAVVRGWHAIPSGRIEGGVQLYGSRWDSPGFVNVARYNTRDLRAPVDSTDGGASERLIVHGRLARTLGRVAGRPVGLDVTAWGQRSRQTMFLNVPGEGAVVRQSEENDARTGVGAQAQASLPLPSGEIVVGVSGRRDVSDYTMYRTFARARSSLDHSYDAGFSSGALFTRWRSLIASRVALDLGGRVDVLRYDALDRVAAANAGAGVPRRSATQVIAAPKAGARYFVPGTWRGLNLALLASASRGFRGAVGVIADPTRDPMLAWSYDAGLEASAVGLELRASVFRTDVTNERVFNPVTLGVSGAGASRRQGLDVRAGWTQQPSLEGTPSSWWRVPAGTAVFGAFTINDARFLGATLSTGGVITRPTQPGNIHDHNVPILPGDPVPGVARVTARVGAEGGVLRSGADWRLSYRILGGFVPIGEPGVRTRTASVLDAGVTLPLGGVLRRAGLSLDLDLQNVLDLRFVENRASGFITPGVPRVLRASFRFL
jgi:iron complex outermembrane receptor protein